MENVWARLHPLGENKIPCDLGDYSKVSCEDVVAALKEGLKEAQKMPRALNMVPSTVAR
jgi:hypothetical protein